MHILKREKSNNLFSETVCAPRAHTAIVFLHGMAGSHRMWGALYRSLSPPHSLYFVDLLGFGHSEKPDSGYSMEAHVKALHQYITENVPEKNVVLLGHSVGALIALGYLRAYPSHVKKVIALSLPCFHSEYEAKKHLQNGWPALFLSDSPLLKIICTTICRIGYPFSSRLMPFFMPNLPTEVISDSFLHTYTSYISTLKNVVYKEDITALLSQEYAEKITLIHGQNDAIAPLQNVRTLSLQTGIPLHILPAKGHTFPITHPKETVGLIQLCVSLNTPSSSSESR